MQVLAREEGLEVNSPRKAFQEAFAMGWISDEEIWSDIIKARNMAVHVYRQKLAEELYAKLDRFYEAFGELHQHVN